MKGGDIIFIVFLVFGLYFLNSFFSFIAIPASILSVTDKWAELIGGGLLIIGGFKFFNFRNRGKVVVR